MKKTKTAIPSSVHRCMGRDGVIREENSGQDRLLEKALYFFLRQNTAEGPDTAGTFKGSRDFS